MDRGDWYQCIWLHKGTWLAGRRESRPPQYHSTSVSRPGLKAGDAAALYVVRPDAALLHKSSVPETTPTNLRKVPALSQAQAWLFFFLNICSVYAAEIRRDVTVTRLCFLWTLKQILRYSSGCFFCVFQNTWSMLLFVVSLQGNRLGCVLSVQAKHLTRGIN